MEENEEEKEEKGHRMSTERKIKEMFEKELKVTLTIQGFFFFFFNNEVENSH